MSKTLNSGVTDLENRSPSIAAKIVGILAVLAALLLILNAAHQRTEVLELDMTISTHIIPPCKTPLTFTYLGVYSSYTGPILLQDYAYPGSGLVRARVCSRGTLTVTVQGEPAGGEPPRLDIQLDNHILLSEHIEGNRTLTVKVNPGLLALIYANDFYDPHKGDRNLTLKRVKFDSK